MTSIPINQARALEIGAECLNINSAISELHIAIGNYGPRESDNKRPHTYVINERLHDHPLFQALSDRRAALRRELYDMIPIEIEDDPQCGALAESRGGSTYVCTYPPGHSDPRHSWDRS